VALGELTFCLSNRVKYDILAATIPLIKPSWLQYLNGIAIVVLKEYNIKKYNYA